MKIFRPTVRMRLTWLYGGLFLAAGALLLTINYTLVRQSLMGDPVVSTNIVSVSPPDSNPVDIPDDAPTWWVEEHDEPISTHQLSEFREWAMNLERQVRDETLRQLLMQSGLAFVVTGFGAVIAGWIVAGRVLHPIRRITNAAQRASDANLHGRVGLNGPEDELKELADTFDTMLSRLEVAFESQRRFAAVASHELRTPISIMRTEAEVTLSSSGATEHERRLALTVQSAAIRGERLIDSLLALARSESTMHDRDVVDLTEVVGDCIGGQARNADHAGIELDLKLDDALVVGDRMLLERLVTNLVENAIAYNVPEGWVRVSVGTLNHSAVMQVINSGPVITSAEIDALFEPFQRRPVDGANARPGFGLGLPIVRSIAVNHGGTVAAIPGEAGGLDITVRMPSAHAPVSSGAR